MAVISPPIAAATTVRCEAINPEHYYRNRNLNRLPHLSISKPCWIVRTEKWKEIISRRELWEYQLRRWVNHNLQSAERLNIPLDINNHEFWRNVPTELFTTLLTKLDFDPLLESLPSLHDSPSTKSELKSNVRKEERKKPDPPCVICKGSGRVDCHHCYGKGRTNHAHLAMLPNGEWPKWCRTCGGSGLGYCSRCLGTGEYRYIMGFRFMRKSTDDTQDHKIHKVRSNPGPHSAADLFLNGEQLNSCHDM